MLSKNQKEEIINKLTGKIKTFSCPMCRHQNFGISDGFFLNSMQDDLKKVTLGGPIIPTISLICNNCGFVSQHAIGVLGMLDKINNSDERK